MGAIPETEIRERLAGSHVAILGCGGLGSNIAGMLVRAGVGTLTLVDFDVVEADNLNRQLFFVDQLGRPKVHALAETLHRIDASVILDERVEGVTVETLARFVKAADVVVEAVDAADTKALIAEEITACYPSLPLVMASGIAGYDLANRIVTEQVAERVWVIGDQESDVRVGNALLAPRVMLAAAHQAHAVIRLLLGLNPV